MIPDPSLYEDWKQWAEALTKELRPSTEPNALTDQALIAPLPGTIIPLRRRQIVLEVLDDSSGVRIVARMPDGTIKTIDLT